MNYIINLLVFLFSLTYMNVLVADEYIKVNFSGSIKAKSCTVFSAAQNIDLGTWFLEGNGRNFARDSVTDWVEFDLAFNCSPDKRQVVGVLEGTPAELDNKLFELDKSAGSASGMAIQIEAYSPENKRWEEKNANEVSTLISFAGTTSGMNTVQLRARYKQLADSATGGDANASITFVVRNN
ncbi:MULTISPECIES: fimbrial protein [Providencia]|nr:MULTISPECIES: fimbrial protein [Providencia]APC13075.1 fimbrial-like adhesin protein SfmF [Providencia rettgeri]EIL1984758.1 fimbrial protein [Providencia rettgeri]EIU7557650.1 fimbrial protein [Providencia rettgeri]EIU9516697.1 fimbrial protein [Providencia rettgeri]EJD6042607.1 fimbrial protein [Providencia rettgeri]